MAEPFGGWRARERAILLECPDCGARTWCWGEDDYALSVRLRATCQSEASGGRCRTPVQRMVRR